MWTLCSTRTLLCGHFEVRVLFCVETLQYAYSFVWTLCSTCTLLTTDRNLHKRRVLKLDLICEVLHLRKNIKTGGSTLKPKRIKKIKSCWNIPRFKLSDRFKHKSRFLFFTKIQNIFGFPDFSLKKQNWK